MKLFRGVYTTRNDVTNVSSLTPGKVSYAPIRMWFSSHSIRKPISYKVPSAFLFVEGNTVNALRSTAINLTL
jgi:hypothetical protein